MNFIIAREIVGFTAMMLIIATAIVKSSRLTRFLNLTGSVLLIMYGVLMQSMIIVIMSFSLTIVRMVKSVHPEVVEPGCIIIGYQGIGKSTLSSLNNNYIDLESGSFWIEDKRDPNWYQIYCRIAIDLACQGYRVFTSSHLAVREYLTLCPLPNQMKVFICYPEIDLEDKWIQKLKKRYEYSKLQKDYKAWKNAEDRYVDNIKELMECNAIKIPIKGMHYDLSDIIEKAVKDSKVQKFLE